MEFDRGISIARVVLSVGPETNEKKKSTSDRTLPSDQLHRPVSTVDPPVVGKCYGLSSWKMLGGGDYGYYSVLYVLCRSRDPNWGLINDE